MGQEWMVVLANSRKSGGYCMAGKTLDSAGRVGAWMRPVTRSVCEGLPVHRTFCSDGRQAGVLDVVANAWGQSVPVLHQRENRLIGAAALRRCGRVEWDDVSALADDAPTGLWIDGYSSSQGRNDRVPECVLAKLPGSLRLISAQELVLYTKTGYEGQMKYRAGFRFGKQRYDFALTDAVAASWLKNAPQLALADAYVCISLAVPFVDGFAYKLAAAVITKERAGGRA